MFVTVEILGYKKQKSGIGEESSLPQPEPCSILKPPTHYAGPKVYGTFNEQGRRRKYTVCRLTEGRAKVREMVVIPGTAMKNNN